MKKMDLVEFHRAEANKHLSIVAELTSPKSPRAIITQAVCEAFGVKPEELRSRRKFKTVARARAAFSWIARNVIEPRPSFPDIANWHTPPLDHTSVMYHIDAVEAWKQTDTGTGRKLMVAVDRVKNLLDIPRE